MLHAGCEADGFSVLPVLQVTVEDDFVAASGVHCALQLSLFLGAVAGGQVAEVFVRFDLHSDGWHENALFDGISYVHAVADDAEDVVEWKAVKSFRGGAEPQE